MSNTAIVGENVEVIQTRGPQGAVTWSAVIAGALAAWAVAFIFISLGSGVGLSVASPYSGPDADTMTIGGAIWMIFANMVAFAVGGYLAARLRIRDHIPGHETKFRDGAHGFLAWVVGASFMALALFVAGAFTARTAATAVGSGVGIAASALGETDGGAAPYYVDRMFRADPRPARPTADAAMQPPPSASNNAGGETNNAAPASASASPQTDRQDSGGVAAGRDMATAQRDQAVRIVVAALSGDKMADDDHEYLAQMVAARTGMTQAEADRRVTEVTTQAREKITAAADAARKAAAYFSFWSFMALLFGAVCAAWAGMLGGELRDEM